MPRNLFERCEVAFPVRDPQLKARLRNEILAAYLADTTKARMLFPEGEYVYVNQATHGKAFTPFSAQEFLMQLAEGKVGVDEIPPAAQPVVSKPRAAIAEKSAAKKAPAKKAAKKSATGLAAKTMTDGPADESRNGDSGKRSAAKADSGKAGKGKPARPAQADAEEEEDGPPETGTSALE